MYSLSELRIGFAGTPEFAATILDALIGARAEIAVVYSQPDRAAGRGRRLTASPVKQLAQSHGLTIEQPPRLRGAAAAEKLASYELDLLVVAAYGLILPQAVLDTPRLGCLNVHASLLPRWRGAAPIERAIMAGDSRTGVCIMQMEAGLDTGGVYAGISVDIAQGSTGKELHEALAVTGAQALLGVLSDFDPAACTPQDEVGATYADKLQLADTAIDWSRPADAIANQINALNDRLPARTEIDGELVNLLHAHAQDANAEVAATYTDVLPQTAKPHAPGTLVARNKKGLAIACGEGWLRVREVQLRRGKARPMPIAAALNGYPEIFRLGRCCAP